MAGARVYRPIGVGRAVALGIFCLALMVGAVWGIAGVLEGPRPVIAAIAAHDTQGRHRMQALVPWALISTGSCGCALCLSVERLALLRGPGPRALRRGRS